MMSLVLILEVAHNLVLYTTMLMVPTGIRTLWASSRLGIPINRMPCSGGGDSNPGGGGYTHVPWGSVTASFCFAAFLALGAHSSCLGGNAAAVLPSLASPRSMVSSRVQDASCQSSTGSGSMASRMSSSVNCTRLVMYSQRSLAAPDTI